MYRHTSLYCTSLYCTLQIMLFFSFFSFFFLFYKLKVCGNPVSSSSTGGAIFPTAFAHFVSLGHVLVSLTIFQTFSLLYLLHDL